VEFVTAGERATDARRVVLGGLVTNVGAISSDHLRRLHPRVIEGPAEIAFLLQRLPDEQVTLRQGLNRRIEPETARLVELTGEHLVLDAPGFVWGRGAWGAADPSRSARRRKS
jgi:hypothetical protein